MNSSIQTISMVNLALVFIPVFAVVGVLYRWSLGYRNALYGVSRMLVQLLLVGYVLAFIFQSDSSWIVLSILVVMVSVSSWISLHAVRETRSRLYTKALLSLVLGGGATLIIVTQGVLNLEPWYRPSYFIPLAGMIFANAMNSVSLAADRLGAETERGVKFEEARNIAFSASLIPITNSLFAVGLVAIPGMMTGQILSGVPPLIAARYQIMVMCMVYGAAGISAACFLVLARPQFENQKS